jgi:hypothetical protein
MPSNAKDYEDKHPKTGFGGCLTNCRGHWGEPDVQHEIVSYSFANFQWGRHRRHVASPSTKIPIFFVPWGNFGVQFYCCTDWYFAQTWQQEEQLRHLDIEICWEGTGGPGLWDWITRAGAARSRYILYIAQLYEETQAGRKCKAGIDTGRRTGIRRHGSSGGPCSWTAIVRKEWKKRCKH